jgi:iron complex outermembrane recepter protein
MRIAILSAIILIPSLHSEAQEVVRDTTLREVVIHAYNTERTVNELAASVAVVDQNVLNRFHNFSLVPAVNTVPGVRMEERSPGSYRFAIRGSSIRSPFGVRNVKVYLNRLPFTDAGGNTYLNIIDPAALNEVEVIKGPGGSLYGAGTGGVVLLKRFPTKINSLNVSAQGGSYGSQRYVIDAGLAKEKVKGSFNLSRQQSNGYRQQSGLERNAFSGTVDFRAGRSGIVTADLLFTNILYETPGGLTLYEYNTNPSAARPQATDQNAAVLNKTVFAGATYDYNIDENFGLVTSIFGGATDFENPSIREYEIRAERNIGVRSTGRYVLENGDTKWIFAAGLEAQHLNSPIKKYKNVNGSRGSLESDNKLGATSSLFFLQSDYEVNSWIFTTALSANLYRISFDDNTNDLEENKNFNPAFLPRIALLKKMKDLSLYASFSRGFSPPTLGDLYPTGSAFNNELEAEYGNNIEVGVKSAIEKKLHYEVSVYQFRLENTIVAREDEFGYDYFVNAGKTNQFGIEALNRWNIYENKGRFLSFVAATTSYTYNHYRFENYTKVSTDLSGNKLTGVAPTVIYGAVDAKFLDRAYLNISYNFVDHIPLNDENTVYAKSYHLLGFRSGYCTALHGHQVEVYIGADNLLDKKYSLGNDINAFGGRYYNAAARMNFYGGIKLNFNFKPD